MYKILTLFLMACLCQAVAYAQPNKDNAGMQQAIRMVRSLNAAQSPAPVSKTTAIQQRVTGYRRANAAGQTNDSMRYVYDFGRGSEFDFDNMTYYDDPLYPDIYGDKLVVCDSAYRYGSLQKTSWLRYAGTRLVHRGQETTSSIDSIDWIYDAQGRQTGMKWERYDKTPPPAWHPDVYYYYLYDAAGRVVKDSSERQKATWGINMVGTLTYNAAGLVDTLTYITGPSAFIPIDYRYVFGYTGTHMTSILRQRYGSGTWNEFEKKTLTYTGDQKVSEITEEWNNGWVLQSAEYRHLNANGLPDSIYFGTRGNFNPVFAISPDTIISKVVYNNFGNPVTVDYYDTAMVHEGQVRYWYQEYDPTAIKDITTAKALIVYPNPAKAQLTIAAGTLPAGQVRYHIINTAGQVVRDESGIKNDKIVIELHGLAQGSYWLQLQDAKGDWYRASFSKVE